MEGIGIVIVLAIIWAIVSKLHSHTSYKSQRQSRRDTIKELRESGQSWGDIPLILRNMGYYNEEGDRLTVEELREEYADIIANEKMGIKDD